MYASARFNAVPADDVLAALLREEATVCHHDDIRGGYCVEMVVGKGKVSPAVLRHVLQVLGGEDITVIDIRCVEWFSESMLAAGGRVVAWDDETNQSTVSYGQIESKTPAWWAAHGWLAFHVDAIDIAHPHAVHASASAQSFVSKLDQLWKK